MKKIALLILYISFFIVTKAQHFQWAKSIGGTNYQFSESVCTDKCGNVYTTGYFIGTADFDPGSSVYNLTSIGAKDIFISKLDVNGNFVWAKRIGKGGDNIGWSIKTDKDGNVYTTGYFAGALTDFDPGTGVFNLSPFGGIDMFILKLDALGNFVWVKQIGGASTEMGNAITIDGTGNIYTTGYFEGAVDFDPSASVYNLYSHTADRDIFVLKLDALGNLIWAKDMGGNGRDVGLAITVDNSNNVFTTGYFENTADFDPNSGISNLTSAGDYDVFTSKLDVNGNYLWANRIGNTSYDVAEAITLDIAGNVYISNAFEGTIDFDPGIGIANLTATPTNKDIAVSKYSSTGGFVWAKLLGKGMSWGLASDVNSNIYVCGSFSGASDFDPGSAVHTMTPVGMSDGYITKLDKDGNFIASAQVGGTANDVVKDIAIDIADPTGSINYTGIFEGTGDFNPESGVFNLTSAGLFDVFVSKLTKVSYNSFGAGDDVSVCLGRCIQIGAPGNPDPSLYGVTYNWSPSLGNVANPLVCPTTNTTYTLTVSFDNGCVAPITSDVNVTVLTNCLPENCKPSPVIPTSGCIGESITFDIGSRKCADQCLGITYWDFGDGTGTGNIVSHIYTTPGTYTITVSTTDNCGHLSYFFTQTITITDCGCVQSLVATQMSCNEFNFTLNCQACVKEMQINYFDGSPAVTCPLGCSFVHTFPADGTYPVGMIVTLCDGTRLRLSTTVEVACPQCKCEIKADFTVDGDHPKYFTSTSATGAGTNILGYMWDFGDGNTALNDPNPSHDYGSIGSYNVCLTVLGQHDEDKSRCWDQICLPVDAARRMMDGKAGSELSTTQSNTAGDITIFPNPAYSSISIDYLLDIADKANLEIVNAEGVVLTTKVLDAQKGSVKLDVSSFADGLYICQIKQAGASAKTAKFSVVKH